MAKIKKIVIDKDKSLLERAKEAYALNYGLGTTSQEIELALAWLKNDVSTGQCAKAVYTVNHTNSKANWRYKASRLLQQAYFQGKLKIVEKES